MLRRMWGGGMGVGSRTSRTTKCSSARSIVADAQSEVYLDLFQTTSYDCRKVGTGDQILVDTLEAIACRR